ncbi:dipeptidase [Alicyclobacillus tolerans]|uniref:dipeptidase n=1 Tax=Alicyclobacillus tolerans TaxID=90970 RepID=UPI003B7E3C65
MPYEKAEAYIKKHQNRMLQDLFNFLSIPSLSKDSKERNGLYEAAEFLSTYLNSIGIPMVRWITFEDAAPIIYAERHQGSHLPTILIYGHYDVQPPGKLEEWCSPPFAPEIRGNCLYARGASDDKGQLLTHLQALEAVIQTGRELPFNIKFLFEGEEEIGSPGLLALLSRVREARFVEIIDEQGREHTLDLQADVVAISDTPFLLENQPALCIGTRGLCGIEITVHGPAQDLHSGGYGGLVENPLHALSAMIHSLHNVDGSIAVNGFYNDIASIPNEIRSIIQQTSPSEELLLQQLGVPALYGEAGYTPLERIWIRPSLEVNRMYGGDIGSSPRTIIPSVAHATVTVRLALGQNPAHIADIIQKHLMSKAPSTVRVNTKLLDQCWAWMADVSHTAYAHALQALAYGFGKEATFIQMGGSIPVLAHFSEHLQAQVVLLGFGLPSDNIHSANENFSLSQREQGLRTLVAYYQTPWPPVEKGSCL